MAAEKTIKCGVITFELQEENGLFEGSHGRQMQRALQALFNCGFIIREYGMKDHTIHNFMDDPQDDDPQEFVGD